MPLPLTVQRAAAGSNDWLPARAGFPTSAEFQCAAESSVHITRAWLDWKLPTVVTLATTTSSPSPAPGKEYAAWPLALVTAAAGQCPASGPLVTVKFTVACGSPAPLPSSSVAVSVTGFPVNCVIVAGPRLSVA